MAEYKVPQDVEADDKLLGPFSFRQFVYLMIAGGLIALAVGLFQLFPVLAIIPVPFVLFFAALALPLKKDQPMETYLAAIVSFYLKPRVRKWTSGQKDVAIDIIAPKKRPEDEMRTRDISGEEATHRLSFLANIVDTEGYAIKGVGAQKVNDDLVLEANSMSDIFETNHYDSLENTIAKDENEKRERVMEEMRKAIVDDAQSSTNINASVASSEGELQNEDVLNEAEGDNTLANGMDSASGFEVQSPVVVIPGSKVDVGTVEKSNYVPKRNNENKDKAINDSIIELANNTDFSIATISKEANRIKEREKGEVFVSLH